MENHVEIDAYERSVLGAIAENGCLPVTRFLATSSEEDEIIIDCLSPVYLFDREDSMEDVKAIGAVLRHLEEEGLLTLDYEIPIEDYDYELYENSALYAYFVQTIAQAKGQPGFLCDLPLLEKGSMALTEKGEQALNR